MVQLISQALVAEKIQQFNLEVSTKQDPPSGFWQFLSPQPISFFHRTRFIEKEHSRLEIRLQGGL